MDTPSSPEWKPLIGGAQEPQLSPSLMAINMEHLNNDTALPFENILTPSQDTGLMLFHQTWEQKFNLEQTQGLQLVVPGQGQDAPLTLPFQLNSDNIQPPTPYPAPCVTPGSYTNCPTPGPYSASTTPVPFVYSGCTTPGPMQVTAPGTDAYPGEYGFQINFAALADGKQTKSMSWTFSPGLNKLFCQSGRAVPLKYRTSTTPPASCFVRALAAYESPEWHKDVVTRCPNDIQRDAQSPATHYTWNHHFIHVDNDQCVYQDPDAWGRQSVMTPFSPPEVGEEFSEVLIRFMCSSTCTKPSIGRRPIVLILTLEDSTGQVLGRDSKAIGVCTCPGRDRKNAEAAKVNPTKKPLPKKGCSPDDNSPKRPKKPKIEPSSIFVTSRDADDDDEIRFVAVRGKRKYEELLGMKTLLDLKYGLEDKEQGRVLAEVAAREALSWEGAQTAPVVTSQMTMTSTVTQRVLPKKKAKSPNSSASSLHEFYGKV